jgi:hypothetical protein
MNVGGVVTKYGYDSDGKLLWTNYDSNVPQEIYFNGRHFGYLYANSDASLNHVVYSSVDWLGTELARFDAGQNIVTKLTYLPFGDGLSVFRGSDTPALGGIGRCRRVTLLK